MNFICPPAFRGPIAVVGESPGPEECERHEGFVGPSGRAIEKACRTAGIDWPQVSKFNVVQRPPDGGYSSEFFRSTFYQIVEEPLYTKTGKPSKRTRKHIEPTSELLDWIKLLEQNLTALKPQVIVAVGNEALKALTGKDGIHDWRGSVLPWLYDVSVPVVPTVRPSYVVRGQWLEWWYIVFDVKKAASLLTSSPCFSYDIKIRPSLDDIIEFLTQVSATRQRWCVDVETVPPPVLSCIGIALASEQGTRAICIPLREGSRNLWSLSEYNAIISALTQAAATNPNGVFHNAPYDLSYLTSAGIHFHQGYYMDTMPTHALLFPEFPRGLEFLGSLYLRDWQYYESPFSRSNQEKRVGLARGKKWDDLYIYNCLDVIRTLQLSYELDKHLDREGLREKWAQEIQPLVPLAFEMEQQPLAINEDYRNLLATLLREEIVQVHNKLVSAVGAELNVNSPKQVQCYLYEKLKLPGKRNRKTGGVTADENALRELRMKFPQHSVLNLIIEERHLRKRKSSYIDLKLEEMFKF